jgi:hypothetical protein
MWGGPPGPHGSPGPALLNENSILPLRTGRRGRRPRTRGPPHCSKCLRLKAAWDDSWTMRLLSRVRLLLTLLLISVAIYRLGLRGWLARQEPWEWGLAALILAVLAACLAFMRMKPTFLFILAWIASGLGATAGCVWLCWYTWTHPASRNWFAIPAIGALALFAFFVFWYPVLSKLSKSGRLIDRLERAIKSSDANADRYLWEARQVVGTGGNLNQMYLDAFEGKLCYAQGKPALAVEPLERAVANAASRGDQTLGRDAAGDLVRVLVALSRDEEAAALTDEIEEQWGESAELRSALQMPAATQSPVK